MRTSLPSLAAGAVRSLSSERAVRLQIAMREAAERGKREGVPRCYYWRAVWWRLHARESADPATCLQYSRNQQRLYWEMVSRPEI